MTMTSIERMRSLVDVGVENISVVGNKSGEGRPAALRRTSCDTTVGWLD
jgi:hypothetical protein